MKSLTSMLNSGHSQRCKICTEHAGKSACLNVRGRLFLQNRSGFPALFWMYSPCVQTYIGSRATNFSINIHCMVDFPAQLQ